MTGAEIVRVLGKLPYASFINVEPILMDEELTMVMRYQEKNIGNPFLPALHGGAIGGFLEVSAIAGLMFSGDYTKVPKPIGLNIGYLRRGKPQDCFARTNIVRQGSRIANVRVEAWQDDMDNPVAVLMGNFLTADYKG
ncbi:MAG: PaaI family thioesterase [Hellea sp.]|nr:PaaI family thioesterase [Hellea sp.]